MLEKVLYGKDFDEHYHIRRIWSYAEDGYTVSEYATDYCAVNGVTDREYLRSLTALKYAGDEIIMEETLYDPDGSMIHSTRETESIDK